MNFDRYTQKSLEAVKYAQQLAVGNGQQQLEQIIGQLTPEAAAENCEAILRFYGDCETGHAAESVANIIKNWIEK